MTKQNLTLSYINFQECFWISKQYTQRIESILCQIGILGLAMSAMTTILGPGNHLLATILGASSPDALSLSPN